MAVARSLTSRRLPTVVESAVLFAGCVLGSFILSLLAWVIVPSLIFGWEPLAITSGSMAPAVRSGDVVLVDPDFGAPGPGSVVAFESEDTVVVHRVAEAHPDGSLTTRGDANPSIDSSPVTSDRLMGTGRLLVPFIGYLKTVGWAPLLIVAAVSGGLVWWWPKRPVIATTLLALTVAVGLVASATGSFMAATGNEDSSLNALEVAPPINVTTSCQLLALGSIRVTVSWDGPTTPGLTSYNVYRDGPGGGTNFELVESVVAGEPEQSVHVISASLFQPPATYTYMVRSVVDPWESENSNTDSVTVTLILCN